VSPGCHDGSRDGLAWGSWIRLVDARLVNLSDSGDLLPGELTGLPASAASALARIPARVPRRAVAAPGRRARAVCSAFHRAASAGSVAGYSGLRRRRGHLGIGDGDALGQARCWSSAAAAPGGSFLARRSPRPVRGGQHRPRSAWPAAPPGSRGGPRRCGVMSCPRPRDARPEPGMIAGNRLSALAPGCRRSGTRRRGRSPRLGA
jgi:hypothetical protein